jgi:DNA-binding protein YbaB
VTGEGAEVASSRELQARVDQLFDEYRRLRDGMSELQQKLLAVKARVTSDDGAVTVTVGPRGHLVEIEFDPRIYRRPNTKALAASVLDAVQRATDQTSRDVEALVKEYTPEEIDFKSMTNFDFSGLLKRSDSELTDGGTS